MPMTFAARTFARRTAFFRLDNASAGDGERPRATKNRPTRTNHTLQLRASGVGHLEKQTTTPAGRRSCRRKSGAAQAQKPQVCRPKTGRPDLSYKMPSDPPSRKGGAPEKAKSRFVARRRGKSAARRGRRPAQNEDGRTGSESEESCREWHLASGSSGAAFHHAHRFEAHDNFFVLI
jgi:hypothetical protein